MSEQLTDEEMELLQKHRAAKAKQAGRKVTIKGKHEDSGAEYSFDLDGEEAERVIARHKGLWAEDDEDAADEPDDQVGARRSRKASAGDAGSGEAGAGEGRKAPAYFRK